MSRVILLAADRPLPLLEPAFRRVRCTGRFTVETDGFSVRPHEYYRGAVDELGLELKPFQYELDLEATQEDVNALRAYLAGHCRPGEQVELWNLGGGGPGGPSVPLPGGAGRPGSGHTGAAVFPSRGAGLPWPMQADGHDLMGNPRADCCPERRTNYAKQSNWTHQ